LRIENSSEIYSISQLLLRNERKNEKVGWIYLSDAFQKRKRVFPKFLFLLRKTKRHSDCYRGHRLISTD